jgi:hypothetical protein
MSRWAHKFIVQSRRGQTRRRCKGCDCPKAARIASLAAEAKNINRGNMNSITARHRGAALSSRDFELEAVRRVDASETDDLSSSEGFSSRMSDMSEVSEVSEWAPHFLRLRIGQHAPAVQLERSSVGIYCTSLLLAAGKSLIVQVAVPVRP